MCSVGLKQTSYMKAEISFHLILGVKHMQENRKQLFCLALNKIPFRMLNRVQVNDEHRKKTTVYSYSSFLRIVQHFGKYAISCQELDKKITTHICTLNL